MTDRSRSWDPSKQSYMHRVRHKRKSANIKIRNLHGVHPLPSLSQYTYKSRYRLCCISTVNHVNVAYCYLGPWTHQEGDLRQIPHHMHAQSPLLFSPYSHRPRFITSRRAVAQLRTGRTERPFTNMHRISGGPVFATSITLEAFEGDCCC